MPRTNTPKPTITFACDQDWNDMQITEKGRFCSVCTKEVIDFTRFSLTEIQAYKSKNNQLCGHFLAEQVDLSLIKPIRIPPRVRIFTFVSSVLLSSQNANAQSNSTENPKMELSINYFPKSVEIIKQPKDTTVKTNENIQPKKVKRTRNFYWSKKFPFIKRKYKYREIMGAYAFVNLH